MALRDLFDRHKEEIWHKLCEELEGEFVDKKSFSQDKVRARVGQWTVLLDVHTSPGYRTEVRYTRFSAPYVNADGFHFHIYKDTIFRDIAAMFNHEYVKTGYPELDEKFSFKSTNKQKLQALVKGSRFRALLLDCPDIHLFVRHGHGWFADEFPDGVDELVLEVEGEVTDFDRLKRLYVLFAACLHRLCAIGSAYEDDPHIDL